MKQISSRDNAAWKSLVRLCHSGRERRKQGKCVLEGAHTIHSYVERFGEPELLIVDAARANEADALSLADRVGDSRLILAHSRPFAELAPTATPGGVLAV